MASGPGTYSRPLNIAVVVSGWPRVSETFALHELLSLHERGVLAAIYATKRVDSPTLHPAHRVLEPHVIVLPDGDPGEQGAALARHAATLGVTGVHGYFAHVPADVAHRAASHLGVPFGFSAHALDARKADPGDLRRRAADAAVIAACNPDVAAALAAVGVAPAFLPHGVDTGRFRPPARRPRRAPQVLAVGRFVEKKGFSVLIDAMALLPKSLDLEMVGDGPLAGALRDQITRRRLRGRVVMRGVASHLELPARYRESAIVAVPSVVDGRGDRDGLPNVLLEAMATGCAVVASEVAAIASVVRSGVNGVLVPPGDPEALAASISTLAADEELRLRLGAAARATTLERFRLDRCASAFAEVVSAAYAPSAEQLIGASLG